MDTLNLTEYISTIVDNLDKVIEYLKACQERKAKGEKKIIYYKFR